MSMDGSKGRRRVAAVSKPEAGEENDGDGGEMANAGGGVSKEGGRVTTTNDEENNSNNNSNVDVDGALAAWPIVVASSFSFFYD